MTDKSRKIVRSVIKFLTIGTTFFLVQTLVSRYISDPAQGAESRYSDAWSDYRGAREDIDRFHALGDLAKESFHTGRFDDAKKYADELARLTPRFSDNWNYGNAIQDSNIVHGLLALRNGDRESAKKHLTAAGNSPGSPQMNSFGPNMSLAKALLGAGEREAVLSYFDQCSRFWSSHQDKLDRWKFLVSWGITPDFGTNMIY